MQNFAQVREQIKEQQQQTNEYKSPINNRKRLKTTTVTTTSARANKNNNNLLSGKRKKEVEKSFGKKFTKRNHHNFMCTNVFKLKGKDRQTDGQTLT